VEPRQIAAEGGRAISRVRCLQRLLTEDDRHGIDLRIDRLDPPQVSLDHFPARDLHGPDRFGQLSRAHAPQLRSDVHAKTP
jgi:hypothetical protein